MPRPVVVQVQQSMPGNLCLTLTVQHTGLDLDAAKQRLHGPRPQQRLRQLVQPAVGRQLQLVPQAVLPEEGHPVIRPGVGLLHDVWAGHWVSKQGERLFCTRHIAALDCTPAAGCCLPPTISGMCTTHRRATNGLQAREGTQVCNMYYVMAPWHHDGTTAPVQHSGTSCHTMQGGRKCKGSAARYKAVLTLSHTNPNCPAWSCWGSAKCMRASWRPSSATLIQGGRCGHMWPACAGPARC